MSGRGKHLNKEVSKENTTNKTKPDVSKKKKKSQDPDGKVSYFYFFLYLWEISIPDITLKIINLHPNAFFKLKIKVQTFIYLIFFKSYLSNFF